MVHYENMAAGYVNGERVIEDTRKTPGIPFQIQSSWDESDKPLKAGCNDVVFVHAAVADIVGTVNSGSDHVVEFKVAGDASIIGPKAMSAAAGIASILLKAGNDPGKIKITAKAPGLETRSIQMISVNH